MNFKPHGARVLIQEDARETLTSSGFIIPDTSAESANRGTILSVGPGEVPKKGKDIVPVELEVGQRILYAPGSGQKVVVAGKQYLVLKTEEVLALVDKQ